MDETEIKHMHAQSPCWGFVLTIKRKTELYSYSKSVSSFFSDFFFFRLTRTSNARDSDLLFDICGYFSSFLLIFNFFESSKENGIKIFIFTIRPMKNENLNKSLMIVIGHSFEEALSQWIQIDWTNNIKQPAKRSHSCIYSFHSHFHWWQLHPCVFVVCEEAGRLSWNDQMKEIWTQTPRLLLLFLLR